MTDRALLQQALEALELLSRLPTDNALDYADNAITALRERLAQPEQEPVAWATREDFYREIDRSVERVRKEMQIKSVTMRGKDYDLALPIIDAHFGHVFVGQVPTPPQRKPLTDEEMQSVIETALGLPKNYMPLDNSMKLGRAIESAHGIKGEA